MGTGTQRGVALIKAMLVVALATGIAVAMVSRQQFDIRRTGNLLQADQAGLYADGVDSWAAQVLRRDREDNSVDNLEEDWATILPPIPVEGGSISGQILDLSGRFNLNALAPGGKVNQDAVEQFKRLLAALQTLHPDVAAKLGPELADVVVDWIDSDQEMRFPGGAEDAYYMNLERPYRSANAPMASPSELLLLKGVDAELYGLLREHVTALPSGSKINVNTASVAVVMSLANGISAADAEALEQDRPYNAVNDFVTNPALGTTGNVIKLDRLTVQSEHFLIISQVQFGTLYQQRYSVLKRDTSGAGRILMRAQGSY